MNTPAAKRCLDCGYILDGLPEARCPECGRRFDPRVATTYSTRLPGGFSGLRLLAGAGVTALVTLAVAITLGTIGALQAAALAVLGGCVVALAGFGRALDAATAPRWATRQHWAALLASIIIYLLLAIGAIAGLVMLMNAFPT